MLNDICQSQLVRTLGTEIALHQVIMHGRARASAAAAGFLLAKDTEPLVVMADPPCSPISYGLPRSFGLINEQTMPKLGSSRWASKIALARYAATSSASASDNTVGEQASRPGTISP